MELAAGLLAWSICHRRSLKIQKLNFRNCFQRAASNYFTGVTPDTCRAVFRPYNRSLRSDFGLNLVLSKQSMHRSEARKPASWHTGAKLGLLDSRPKRPSLLNRRKAERRNTPALAAYQWDGSLPKQNSILDISSTGAYLLTQKRWTPGQLLSLTLQRKGPLARTPQHRFAVQAKTVRSGKDGIGVEFLMSEGTDLRLWESPLKTAEEQIEPEDILTEFRSAAAISFLRRKCPGASKEVRELLRGRLSNYRLDSAVEIALHAEEMLVFESSNGKMTAPPNIVLRILEDGSWAENERIQQFWAGLLATSCTTAKNDQSSMVFVDMLSQLTSAHCRIFATACANAVVFESEHGTILSHPLKYSAEEIIQIAGMHDLVKIDRDLEHLADLGLLVKRNRSKFFSLIHEADIAPTNLGLQLYARCNGHRGALEDFYNVARSTVPALVGD